MYRINSPLACFLKDPDTTVVYRSTTICLWPRFEWEIRSGDIQSYRDLLISSGLCRFGAFSEFEYLKLCPSPWAAHFPPNTRQDKGQPRPTDVAVSVGLPEYRLGVRRGGDGERSRGGAHLHVKVVAIGLKSSMEDASSPHFLYRTIYYYIPVQVHRYMYIYLLVDFSSHLQCLHSRSSPAGV